VEDCGREVLEADEDAVVSEVVVGGVVEVGRLGEKGGAVTAIDADEERVATPASKSGSPGTPGVGLGGLIGGEAGHHLAVDPFDSSRGARHSLRAGS
jgi:hypothetical protein